MKKGLLFLLVAMLMLPLTGCGGDSTVAPSKPVDKQEQTKEQVFTPKNDEEAIVCDNEYASVRLEEVKVDKDNNIELSVYMENKTKDQSLSFFTWTAAVNGIQIDPMYGDELEPSTNKTAKVQIPTTYLEMCQIDTYNEISITFNVYDVENMDEEFVAKGTLNFYPYGKEKAEQFVLPMDDSYKVLMDEKDIKIVSLGLQDNEALGYCGMLYIQNDSDRSITASIDESSIDNVAADIFAYIEVDANNVGFVEVYWTGEAPMEYDENGQPIPSDIEVPDPATAKDIKIELSVYDTEDWEGPHIFYETVDLK